MQGQDWEPVILRRCKPAKPLNPANPTNYRSPAATGTESSLTLPNTKILMLTGKSRSEMAQVRVSKGWTQKQLDMHGQFPANSCNAWEAGKLCPTGPQLQKLHRLLGIKLEKE